MGVLALQGAFRAHIHKLEALGVSTAEVRLPEQLDDVDALIMPGGESTTMSMLLESSGLFDAIEKRLADDMPVFGTCAGLILLARSIEDGRPDQRSFGRLDIAVQRNGYGRQVESFECDLDTTVLDDAVHAVFIRAPRVITVSSNVEVLASDHRGDPVLLRDGNALGAAFHPELSDDDRLHRLFVESVAY
ncbi:MAG: pyridoxal 5'-phosphate synthase glutaminase subunit PdxT [Acidimicrobiales bacterium]